jgi:lactam utilization protein B
MPADAFRVLAQADAEELVASVLLTLGELEAVLESETGHLRAGRLHEGLSAEARKTELTSAYLRALEQVKANAIALARFAPEAIERLKRAHERFGRVVAVNQTVLATARAVSESLIKSVAEEMGRARQPSVYAPAGAQAPRAPAVGAPLILSKSL